MAIRLLDGRVFDKEHPISEAELEALATSEEAPDEKQGNEAHSPMLDRWKADDESINDCGTL